MTELPVPVPLSLACPHCGKPVDGVTGVCDSCGLPADSPLQADVPPSVPFVAPETYAGQADDELLILHDPVPGRAEAAWLHGPFVRSLLWTLCMVLGLVLGAYGLGYLLFAKLGRGHYISAPDVAGKTVLAAPEALAPTGAVGPPRLTVLSELPAVINQPATPARSASDAAGEARQAVGAAGIDDSAVANDEGTATQDKLLRRAQRCLDEGNYDCALSNARSVLKQDSHNAAARQLAAAAKSALAETAPETALVVAPASAAAIVQPMPAGAALPAEAGAMPFSAMPAGAPQPDAVSQAAPAPLPDASAAAPVAP